MIKCPHCGKDVPSPTYKQIEAYLLVHIHGHSQAEAAKIIGITQREVSYRLARLKKIRPTLLPTQEEKRTLRKKISLVTVNTSEIIQHF